MKVKRCRGCGETKLLREFVFNPRTTVSYAYDTTNRDDPRNYRPRCSICEITNRTESKSDRRERHKARDTRARHARRFGIPIYEMEHYYGWDLDRIESDIIAVRDKGCLRCRIVEKGVVIFNYIPDGLDDIHIDILDPTEPPFYGVNAAAVCATCNLHKGSRSLLRHAIEEAERQAIARRANRLGQLSLFDPT